MEFQCLFHDVPSGQFYVQWNLNGYDIEILSMSKSPDITQNNYNDNEIILGTMILYLFDDQDIMWDNSKIVCTGHAVIFPNLITITSKSALLRIQGMYECTCVTEYMW